MLLDLSIKQLSEGLKNKRFSSLDLVNECYESIDKLNPEINAFITLLDKGEVIKKAKEADKKTKDNILQGIPFVIKDPFSTKGIRTTAGSNVLGNYIPQYNSTVYQKIIDAGAILIGKTNMDAWGHGASTENTDFNPTKNPWDLTRVAGGSSGGNAAAITARMAAFAIGEDTGGSIRNPSGWCNITGLKVTYGRVSRYGVISYVSSFDTMGPMAKNAEDCAIILKQIAGYDNKDATSYNGIVPDYVSLLDKNIQGKKFRPKSVKRVVDEIAYMLKAGFKEINFLDDTFSTDLNRAKLICEEIIRRGLKFPWHPLNGMRVDRVDSELFSLMKESGCYKVSFGIESGNQEILDRINKGIKLEQVIRAVKLAKKEGFETFGYFMLGLPGETESTMKETVRFAKKLKLDMAKFNITIPLPGTEIFKEWDEKGCIKTKDWAKYNFYAPYEAIYEHPTVPHSILNKSYRNAYLAFYFDPSFLLRRFFGGIKRGVLLRDIKLFFKTSWFN